MPALPEDSVADLPFRKGRVFAVSFGHFVHDTFSVFLAPLLPLIIEKMGLSLTLSASLTVFQRAPAAAAPWIGLTADRRDLRWAIILAPSLTTIAMCLLGIVPGYGTLAALLFVSGFSSVVFHVPSAVMVAAESGRAKGRGVSIYQLGGELARTIGPLLAVAAVSWWGLAGIWRLMPLGLATSLLLWIQIRRLPTRVESGGPRPAFRKSWRSMRAVMLPVLSVVLVRSFLVGSLATFLPVFLTSEGFSLTQAGGGYALYQLAGAIGALALGTLSDRLGRRFIILMATLISPILLLLFLLADGAMRLPLLFALGFFALSTTSVMIALIQENAHGHPATAHGLFTATGFALRSIVVLLVGILADLMGLRAALMISALIGFLALPLTLALPKDGDSKKE